MVGYMGYSKRCSSNLNKHAQSTGKEYAVGEMVQNKSSKHKCVQQESRGHKWLTECCGIYMRRHTCVYV